MSLKNTKVKVGKHKSKYKEAKDMAKSQKSEALMIQG